MTAFISAMGEAWSELRIHKTRVLLASIGVAVSEGAWFVPDDAERLAPAVVVNEAFYTAAGRPHLVTANPKWRF